MYSRKRKIPYSKHDPRELIDRAKALREQSAETSKKLEEVIRQGEKFLHEHDGNGENPDKDI
jgi:hypothetical protein